MVLKHTALALALASWTFLTTGARFPAAVEPAPTSTNEETYVAATLQWPLDGLFLTPFNSWHRGIDIGAEYGTPLSAAAEGWVETVAWEAGYGLYVAVDHGNGMKTIYSHLAEAGVWPGQAVGTGEVLGWVGMTGYATTPHLHFEVLVDGWKTNPLLYLP